MRNIKFRGKDTHTGEWRIGYYNVRTHLWGPEASPTEVKVHQILSGDYVYTVDPETVGQYTGLPDVEGKELYEGDVLKDKYNSKKYVIAWVPGGAALWNCNEYNAMLRRDPVVLWDGLSEMQAASYVTDCLTLIGNIHDNPELLQACPDKETEETIADR